MSAVPGGTEDIGSKSGRSPHSTRRRRRRTAIVGGWVGAVLLIALGATFWVAIKAGQVKAELEAATSLLPELKDELAANNGPAAAGTVESLVQHTDAAREAANDPVWKSLAFLPVLGPNLRAASEVATSANDVARLGAVPLVRAFESLDWKALTPSSTGMDLDRLQKAQPQVEAAAFAVKKSADRLNTIDASELFPQIASPLIAAREELSALHEDLDSAADSARLAPAMLGAETPRRYLLLMQNNAESRATGGIPGALAVLNVERGKISLDSQTSAAALGTFVPPLGIDAEQRAIYSQRVGKFMQDVNLTPDYATTATTALAMWERKKGERLDGALSLDPVALSFILEATGPVRVSDQLAQQLGANLPTQLTSKNVVQTLLSDAYAEIDDPELQDAYFADAAKEIFGAVSKGQPDPKLLLDAVARGVEDRRILLWSANPQEQETLGRYPLGGRISGSVVAPAQFGIYFNDGTGAKMDYWMKRTVQVVKDCQRDGYREVTVRVTSTNAAPTDAASLLPAYVTGDGHYGVPAGSVQTNTVAYGPTQSTVDTVLKDGKQVPFTAQRHSQRPVGTSTNRLAPGETTTLDFNFGHIVQNAEPELVVTPTTQAVKDVLLAPKLAPCE